MLGIDRPGTSRVAPHGYIEQHICGYQIGALFSEPSCGGICTDGMGGRQLSAVFCGELSENTQPTFV